MDVLANAILTGAFGLALWGAWRPHYRAASYLVAGAVVVALIAVLVAAGQTNLVIVSAVVFNHRRSQRSRGFSKDRKA